jgi:hypothetical protein
MATPARVSSLPTRCSMYCPHDDIAAAGDDADGDEDCSTATVAAASASSVSPFPPPSTSKNPLPRVKAWSGKWVRPMTSGGAEGGDLARAARSFVDSPSAADTGKGDGLRNRRRKRSRKGGASSREVWSVDAAQGRRQREKRGARETPPNFPSLLSFDRRL